MASQKQKKSTKTGKFELWPFKLTPMHVLIALSAMLNVGLLGLLILLAQTNVFDKQIVQRGVDITCGKEQQAEVAKSGAEVSAFLDYHCVRADASKYYTEGLSNYRVSKGLPAIPTEAE